MYPLVRFCHPMWSWLPGRAVSLGDIYPIVKKGLSPCINMYLGIQYASLGSVQLSVLSHLLSSSMLSIRRRILSLSGHSIRCESISRLLQFGHRSSGNASLEYNQTLTWVPQKPKVCLDHQILFMWPCVSGRAQGVPNLPDQSIHWAIYFLYGSWGSSLQTPYLHGNGVV